MGLHKAVMGLILVSYHCSALPMPAVAKDYI
jgi:hypothetical protein